MGVIKKVCQLMSQRTYAPYLVRKGLCFYPNDWEKTGIVLFNILVQPSILKYFITFSFSPWFSLQEKRVYDIFFGGAIAPYLWVSKRLIRSLQWCLWTSVFWYYHLSFYFSSYYWWPEVWKEATPYVLWFHLRSIETSTGNKHIDWCAMQQFLKTLVIMTWFPWFYETHTQQRP